MSLFISYAALSCGSRRSAVSAVHEAGPAEPSKLRLFERVRAGVRIRRDRQTGSATEYVAPCRCRTPPPWRGHRPPNGRNTTELRQRLRHFGAALPCGMPHAPNPWSN